jgi:hypothetical protein
MFECTEGNLYRIAPENLIYTDFKTSEIPDYEMQYWIFDKNVRTEDCQIFVFVLHPIWLVS